MPWLDPKRGAQELGLFALGMMFGPSLDEDTRFLVAAAFVLAAFALRALAYWQRTRKAAALRTVDPY